MSYRTMIRVGVALGVLYFVGGIVFLFVVPDSTWAGIGMTVASAFFLYGAVRADRHRRRVSP